MNILVSIKKIDEIKPLIDAGVDEFFCGVMTNEWKKSFSHAGTINATPSYYNNFKSFDELKQAVDIIHSSNKKVFLTINSYYYTKRQYSELIDQIKKSIKCGIDAIIVADLGLLLMLNQEGIKIEIHLSVLNGLFNSDALEFYKDLNVKRVVLPKQLSLNETRSIANKNNGIELERFILTSGCLNTESFCRFQHGLIEAKHPLISKFIFNSQKQDVLMDKFSKGILAKIKKYATDKTILKQRVACSINYDIKEKEEHIDKDELIRIKSNITQVLSDKHHFERRNGCCVCSLFDLNKLGIKTIKLERRGVPLIEKTRDVLFLKKMVNKLSNYKTKEDFIKASKHEYKNTYKRECNDYFCQYKQICN